jgi:hypothetical protein
MLDMGSAMAWQYSWQDRHCPVRCHTDIVARKPPEPAQLHKPQPVDEPLVAVRKPTLQVEMTPLSMVVALLLAGMVWMLARLVPVILILVTALMIVATLYPVINWIERHGLRRGMAIAIVFASLLLLLAALLTVTLPALAEGLRTRQYGPLLKASRAGMLTFSENVLEVVAYGVRRCFWCCTSPLMASGCAAR